VRAVDVGTIAGQHGTGRQRRSGRECARGRQRSGVDLVVDRRRYGEQHQRFRAQLHELGSSVPDQDFPAPLGVLEHEATITVFGASLPSSRTTG
jgi:hypothetical protein